MNGHRAAGAGRPTVRFRLDFMPRCAVGIGKIELLEGIARTGSLSSAARAMGMSYRRAWLLLEDLNASFDRPVATTTTGGRGGGGAELTEFGALLVERYRQIERQINEAARGLLVELQAHARAHRSNGDVRPVKRSLR
ncbi:MAG: LysR family transcriptional regulator [Gammaproteobacteria bacterium]|nr:LysR family transcriptional regulator [Gammaproteobacteria bacterium]